MTVVKYFGKKFHVSCEWKFLWLLIGTNLISSYVNLQPLLGQYFLNRRTVKIKIFASFGFYTLESESGCMFSRPKALCRLEPSDFRGDNRQFNVLQCPLPFTNIDFYRHN